MGELEEYTKIDSNVSFGLQTAIQAKRHTVRFISNFNRKKIGDRALCFRCSQARVCDIVQLPIEADSNIPTELTGERKEGWSVSEACRRVRSRSDSVANSIS